MFSKSVQIALADRIPGAGGGLFGVTGQGPSRLAKSAPCGAAGVEGTGL